MGLRAASSLLVFLAVVAFAFGTPGTLQKKKKPTPKKKPVKAAPKPAPAPKPNPAFAPMVGTWYTLDSTGKFAKANKFVFTNGFFQYTGPGWSSAGTFVLLPVKVEAVLDDTGQVVTPAKTITKLILAWTKVDGVKVAKPFYKTIPLSDDKKRFVIERFTYGKS